MKISYVTGYTAYDSNYPRGKENTPTNFITDYQPLTEDDFEIETNRAYRGDDKWTYNVIYGDFRLVAKPEVVAELEKCLPMGKKNYMGGYDSWGGFNKTLRREVKFNGLRTDKAKEDKMVETFEKFKKGWEDTTADRVEELVEKANQQVKEMIHRKNELYMETHMKVLSGQNINQDWVRDELPTTKEDKEIENIKDQIEKLEHKLSNVKMKRRAKRNSLMLELMEKDGWKADESGRSDVLAPVLVERLKEMYKNNEAFEEGMRFKQPR